MKKNNFHYVAVLLDLFYGIDIEEEVLEELGLIAWEYIGNKDTRLYLYKICINPNDNSIKLPCNAVSVESVTTCYEDITSMKNSFVENYIEEGKYFKSPYYHSGKLVPYELVGDTLYFTKNYGTLNILYKGILMDEEGLPELTDKEAVAIATYLAYYTKFKEGLKTNNASIIQMSAVLESKWNKLCDQARVGKLSLNDMNEILNIKNSWNRKSYGISYKPMG